MRSAVARLLVLCTLAAWAVGCGGTLKVSGIQTGKSLNSDNSIGTLATSFKPGDTIYVSVLTDGYGSGSIGVKFSYLGRVISEPERKVTYKGAAATEFHIAYSGGGFPAGEYDIDVTFNGAPAGMRKVRVEQ
jgi:hypothetical protein